MIRRLVVPSVVAVTMRRWSLLPPGATRGRSRRPSRPAACRRRRPRATICERPSTRMEERLRAMPADGDAVVRLAEALMRVQRVNSDAAAVVKAGAAPARVPGRAPDHYEAQRDARAPCCCRSIASATRFARPSGRARWTRATPGTTACIGDAHLELGEYDEAFAAFDRMGAAAARVRPPTRASPMRSSSKAISTGALDDDADGRRRHQRARCRRAGLALRAARQPAAAARTARRRQARVRARGVHVSRSSRTRWPGWRA